MLELRKISKDYVTSSETVKALKDVDLAFRDKEFVSILGASGCGKTTLLRLISGLEEADSGKIILFREVHPENAILSMRVMPSERIIFSRLSQSENAASRISFTEGGTISVFMLL